MPDVQEPDACKEAEGMRLSLPGDKKRTGESSRPSSFYTEGQTSPVVRTVS